MAEYDWGGEKAWIKLGQPYLFTEKYYNYCKTRHAPIAVVYYDTKTSTPSKELYQAAFGSKESVKALFRRLSSYKIQSPTADKFKGGYCCLMVLDRCGNISGRDADASFFSSEFPEAKGVPFAALAVYYDGKKYCHQLPAAAGADALADAIYGKCESGAGGVGKFSAWPGRQAWIDRQPKKPDQETAPEKSGKDGLDKSVLSIGVPPYWEDPTEKKTYDKWDPGYTGEFGGVPKIGSRPEVTWMLNLADVSTPETTYYLIGSYD